MSALILPWRAPRPGPARRWRDWLRLLPFQRYDIGLCDCGCTRPTCYPCALPATNLHATLVDTGGACAGTYGPFLLTYAVAGTVQTWTSTTFVFGCGTVSRKFTLGCIAGSCSWMTDTFGIGATPGWDHPTGCRSATNQYAVTSFSCSPLSITWTFGVFQWTVTP